MNNNSNGKKPSPQLKNIIGISIVIAFVGAIAGILYFMDRNPSMAVFIFGFMLFCAGTGIVISSGLSKEALFPLSFSFIGAVVMTLSGVYMTLVVPVLIIVACVIGGIVMITATYTGHRAKLQRCNEIITAVCIRLNERYDRGEYSIKYIYAPVYNYYYNGQEYTVEATTYSSVGVPEVGSEVKIRINPQKPEDFYRPSLNNRVIVYVLGAAFIIMPPASYILYINERYSRSRNGTSMVYAPVYNYYYDGQEYTVEENTYT